MASSSPPETPPLAATLPQQYPLPRESTVKDVVASGGLTGPSNPHFNLSQHYPLVLDVDTGRPVTGATQLAALYQLNDSGVDNSFLECINGKSKLRVRAQLCIEREGLREMFPPTLDGDHGYEVFFCFSRLISAPSARLEIQLGENIEQLDTARLTVSILAMEYSFNLRDSQQLTSFHCDLPHNPNTAANIQFEANGATLEGFTNLSRFQDLLTDTQKGVVEMAQLQGSSTELSSIELYLHLQELGPRAKTFCEIMEELPNLPSIGRAEWSNYLSEEYDLVQVEALMKQTRGIPNLMLKQNCGITFTSLAHFFADNQVAERISSEEGNADLRMWARADHQVALYSLRGHVVIAMKFGQPVVLKVDHKPKRHCKLPDDLEIKVKIAGVNIDEITACYERDLMGIQHHQQHDAFFVVTSHKTERFHGLLHKPEQKHPQYRPLDSLKPHVNSFWLASVHKTCSALWREPRWHPLMLGQSFDTVECLDVPVEIGSTDDVRNHAKQWLLKSQAWNPPQLEAFEVMHTAPGGLNLVTGMDGTGKTTVLLHSAVYFVLLGGQALVASCENGRAENLAKSLGELTSNVTKLDGRPLKVYIVQSSSRRVKLRDMTAAQAIFKKVGHQEGRVGGLDDYKFAMLSEKIHQNAAWQFSLCNAVAQEADKGELVCFTHLCNAKGQPYGHEVEVWNAFRQLRKLDAEGEIDWTSDNRQAKATRIRFQHVYNACEGYLVAHADIIVTTYGNAKCKELDHNWGRDGGKRNKGAFLDDASDAREMEGWNVITSACSPDLIMMCGDIQQLGPINTSASQEPLCNPFVDRLSMSLIVRLILLGLPSVNLNEQYVMHPILLNFPSQAFYGDELSAAPSCSRGLDEVKPGLKTVLQTILASSVDASRRTQFMDTELTEEQARLSYIEHFFDPRVETDDRKSVVVPTFVDIFFAQVLPGLQAHFEDRTANELVVIVAYSYARTTYVECMHGLQEEQGYNDSWYPRIISVDGARGYTATMAFFDGSMQNGDRLGFLNLPGRANVAMTRATQILWMIGGSLYRHKATDDDGDEDDDASSAFPALRAQMYADRQIWCFARPTLDTFRRLTTRHRAGRQRGTIGRPLAKGIARRVIGGIETANRPGHYDAGGNRLIFSKDDERAPDTNDAAKFVAASEQFQASQEDLSLTISATAKPSNSEVAQHTTVGTPPAVEDDCASGTTDAELFFRIAGRVRGGVDTLSTVPRVSVASSADVGVREVQGAGDGDGSEAARFLALASRIRKCKM